MAKSHLCFLSVNIFVDQDALMRHFGHGIGHLEYGRVHKTETETRNENREEIDQETEYQDEEEGDEPMDVDGNEEEEEPTDENSDSGDDSDDSENSDESGYASF